MRESTYSPRRKLQCRISPSPLPRRSPQSAPVHSIRPACLQLQSATMAAKAPRSQHCTAACFMLESSARTAKPSLRTTARQIDRSVANLIAACALPDFLRSRCHRLPPQSLADVTLCIGPFPVTGEGLFAVCPLLYQAQGVPHKQDLSPVVFLAAISFCGGLGDVFCRL